MTKKIFLFMPPTTQPARLSMLLELFTSKAATCTIVIPSG